MTILKTIISLIAMGSLISLTGCNTVKGVGQDIKQGGQVIENAATGAGKKSNTNSQTTTTSTTQSTNNH